jgi:hypothetical protein
MKEMIRYVANDGTPFNTKKECIDYEKSINKYIVYYKDKETTLIKKEFDDEPLAKRFVADCLHDCYEDKIVGNFKLIHCGKTVEFNSTELAKFVPAHYNIKGEKLNEVFKFTVARNVKIPDYTLHGDYYLADKVILNKNWEEAKIMTQTIDLPNGKKILAHTLSKEELETIPKEERKISENGHCWYWTSTPDNGNNAWYVNYYGDFDYYCVTESDGGGGARLGFKNPFTN